MNRTGTGTGTVTSAPAGDQLRLEPATAGFEHGTLSRAQRGGGVGSEFKGWSGGGCTGTGTLQGHPHRGDPVSASSARSRPPDSTPADRDSGAAGREPAGAASADQDEEGAHARAEAEEGPEEVQEAEGEGEGQVHQEGEGQGQEAGQEEEAEIATSDAGTGGVAEPETASGVDRRGADRRCAGQPRADRGPDHPAGDDRRALLGHRRLRRRRDGPRRQRRGRLHKPSAAFPTSSPAATSAASGAPRSGSTATSPTTPASRGSPPAAAANCWSSGSPRSRPWPTRSATGSTRPRSAAAPRPSGPSLLIDPEVGDGSFVGVDPSLSGTATNQAIVAYRVITYRFDGSSGSGPAAARRRARRDPRRPAQGGPLVPARRGQRQPRTLDAPAERGQRPQGRRRRSTAARSSPGRSPTRPAPRGSTCGGSSAPRSARSCRPARAAGKGPRSAATPTPSRWR